jgi:hypothetical protein
MRCANPDFDRYGGPDVMNLREVRVPELLRGSHHRAAQGECGGARTGAGYAVAARVRQYVSFLAGQADVRGVDLNAAPTAARPIAK